MTTRSDPFRSFAAFVAVVAASALVLQYTLLIGQAPARRGRVPGVVART